MDTNLPSTLPDTTPLPDETILPDATSSKSKEELLEIQLDEIKGTMHENIDTILVNIDLTGDLQVKTDEMTHLSKTFMTQSNIAKKRMRRKNTKLIFCIAGITVTTFYLIYKSIE